jgi:hypothetical protein
MVHFADLGVERPVIVKVAEPEQTEGQQIQNPGSPLAQIEAMDTEQSQECQQNPCDRVIFRAVLETVVCLPVHGWDEEQVHQPPDQEQATCEKPDRTGDRLAVIKPVRPGESKDPEQVADDFAMRVRACVDFAEIMAGLPPISTISRSVVCKARASRRRLLTIIADHFESLPMRPPPYQKSRQSPTRRCPNLHFQPHFPDFGSA